MAMNDELRLDRSVDVAASDVATVDSRGQRLGDTINGVLQVQPVNHVDHRGRVFEVFPGVTDEGFWRDPVTYCYAFTVRANQTKGWGLHQYKDDRYTLIDGEVVTVLYDARVDSPTHGVVQKVVLSPQGVRQLLIPVGVWHLNIALGPTEAHLINHPTKPYVHDQPDRMLLPWDSQEIPFDAKSLFPNQFARAGLSRSPEPLN